MTDLTHEQIDEMEAGREMDALVAERVMGWVKTERNVRGADFDNEWYVKEYLVDLDGKFNANAPAYTTDISAAWEVDKEDWYWEFVEDIDGLQITLYFNHPFPVHVFISFEDYKTKAQAYAFGRCKAALKAVISVDK